MWLGKKLINYIDNWKYEIGLIWTRKIFQIYKNFFSEFMKIKTDWLYTFYMGNKKKMTALERRFSEPRIVRWREFRDLKTLQNRLLCDMQQSEKIVNDLTDKYSASNVIEVPEKKGVEFSPVQTCSPHSVNVCSVYIDLLIG